MFAMGPGHRLSKAASFAGAFGLDGGLFCRSRSVECAKTAFGGGFRGDAEVPSRPRGASGPVFTPF